MYNNRNRKNNHNKGYNKSSFTIDIEQIYRDLKQAISNRCDAQARQRDLWSYARRGQNVSRDMKRVNSRIGESTHKINELVNQLSHVKKYHKAMNMAHNYLTSEIERIKKIINKFEDQIYLVEQGRSGWVNSYGVYHTDNTDARAYLKSKKNILNKLIAWDEHVTRYLA